MPRIAGCDEIDCYRLYRRRHPLLHGYVLPFTPIYAAILYQLRELPYLLGDEGDDEESLVALLFSSNLELPLALLLLTLLAHILVSLSCVWSVHIRCLLTCSTADLTTASLVKVVPTANNGATELTPLKCKDGQTWFEFQKIRYHYSPISLAFSPPSLENQPPLSSYLLSHGLSTSEAASREKQFGRCALSIELPLFSQLFLERATAPFFVFQLCCVLLWCLDEYWMYALFTLIMLVTLECMVVFQQKRNLSSVREMVREPQKMLVCRDQKWEQIPSDRLVPGDVISLHVSRYELDCPCDALLLYGNLIVDEAMLTGESIPQRKEPVCDRTHTDTFSFDRDAKLHVVFSGTKVLQTESPPRGTAPLRPPHPGALACVLRTGFSTSQGRLVRTILYGVKRVTDNNLEALLFLLFLMHFAVLAAGYVWTHGSADPARSRYKLFLQCAFIMTTVVPPELPIILSLAVNNSLITLLRSRIFCTEPFRLPNAGKLSFCCFDKTGTLTSSSINFLGVTNSAQLSSELGPLALAPPETQLVVGFCHSLVSIRGGDMVGDPLEMAAFEAGGWTLGRENRPQTPRGLRVSGSYQVARKFHFNSSEKRMSVICVNSKHRSLVLTKGAPEAVRGLLAEVPGGYDKVLQELVCRGARVLALAFKEFPPSLKMFSSLPRQEAESELSFCGFICFSSSVKPDSKRALQALIRSSHRLMMITGDNSYTACYVANQLTMSRLTNTLILTRNEDKWEWISPDKSVSFPASTLGELEVLGGKYDLCVTGEGMVHCCREFRSDQWIQNVRIFARMSPKQKEQVITSLNRRYYTLMCGDGTNDVGALKHAHIGVSLLSRPPTQEQSQPPPSLLQMARMGRDARREQLMRQADLGDAPPPVKLGDASIASPFTSRSDSIAAVCSIVKHGRCTLVTILQMYKIIAVSALISAYSQSALYLDGIKFSDLQTMLQGMVLAVSFMIFSRIRPLEELSKEKPIPNVFNLYTLSTVFIQSTVHLLSIILLVKEAKLLMPDLDTRVVDLDADFKPSILNTAVFLISLCMQLNTCTINYSGRPFIPSLYENKILFVLLSLGYTSLFTLSLGIPAGFCETMDILILPEQFRVFLLQVIAVDIVASWVLDYILLKLYRKFWLK